MSSTQLIISLESTQGPPLQDFCLGLQIRMEITLSALGLPGALRFMGTYMTERFMASEALAYMEAAVDCSIFHAAFHARARALKEASPHLVPPYIPCRWHSLVVWGGQVCLQQGRTSPVHSPASCSAGPGL